MEKIERLKKIIAEQQKGHENKPRFMIGEQLKEIAEREPKSAELLEQDLQVKEMSLEAAERKLREYADQNHGKERAFCITPIVAERILRDFYKLPQFTEAESVSSNPDSAFIDLSSFL